MGRLQPVHGHGRIRAPGAAGGPADTAALDRALARPPDPGGAAGGLAWPSTGGWGCCTFIISVIRGPSAFFFTAPNFFVVTFALVVVWVYVVLAKRRLGAKRG